MNERCKTSLAVIAFTGLPAIALAADSPQESTGYLLGFLLVITLFFCTLPMMAIKGPSCYGVAAWSQIPIIVALCLLTFLILRRRRVASEWIVLIVVVVYVSGTLLTNLASPVLRTDLK